MTFNWCKSKNPVFRGEKNSKVHKKKILRDLVMQILFFFVIKKSLLFVSANWCFQQQQKMLVNSISNQILRVWYMASVNKMFALFGGTNGSARTITLLLPLSEVSTEAVSLTSQSSTDCDCSLSLHRTCPERTYQACTYVKDTQCLTEMVRH